MAIGIRESTQNFSDFTQENLPLPKFITPLKSQYLIEKILYKIKGRIWDITQSKKLI
ncbi:hypothetical protein [Dapis sp. BLCC M229]|uniref:hypothetical protein n=1 Tax=Dapis sp. BLCC M229 TaxID=3400188 RepID=UPI003CF9FB55